jgi:hypothetical protein
VRARAGDAGLAAAAAFKVLLWLFEAAAFLPDAAFAILFAAARARDEAPASDPFRFRFTDFAATFFIFARIVLGATRALDVDFGLPTRLRAPDEDAALLERFDAVFFTLVADPVFLIFDFTVFFDFLRAAIVKLSTRDRARSSARANSQQRAGCLSTNRATLSKDAQGL